MDFESTIESKLLGLKEEGLFRSLARRGEVCFVHNDYLGLSQHLGIREAGRRVLLECGAGSGGSRLLGGNFGRFEAVENQIATHFRAPAALLFSTGYLANLAAIQAAGELVERIVSDEYNHASLIDGIRLSGREKQIIPHNQWDEVSVTDYCSTLVVTESLFSMDGDPVDWVALQKLSAHPEVFLLLDEAHGAGVFGEEGLGLSEYFPDWSRKAVTVTFGKAYGVAGAAILCSEAFKQWLINRARSFIYTTAPSPAVVAMISEAVKTAAVEPWRRTELWNRAAWVRESLAKLSVPVLSEGRQPWQSRSPIIPIMIRGNDRVAETCQRLQGLGWDVRAIRYPTVARGEERIRLSLNISESRESLEKLVEEVGKQWTAYL